MTLLVCCYHLKYNKELVDKNFFLRFSEYNLEIHFYCYLYERSLPAERAKVCIEFNRHFFCLKIFETWKKFFFNHNFFSVGVSRFWYSLLERKIVESWIQCQNVYIYHTNSWLNFSLSLSSFRFENAENFFFWRFSCVTWKRFFCLCVCVSETLLYRKKVIKSSFQCQNVYIYNKY